MPLMQATHPATSCLAAAALLLAGAAWAQPEPADLAAGQGAATVRVAPAPASLNKCGTAQCRTQAIEHWEKTLTPWLLQAETAGNLKQPEVLPGIIRHYEGVRQNHAHDPEAQAVANAGLSSLYRLQAEQTGQLPPLQQAVAAGQQALAYFRMHNDGLRQSIALGDIANAHMRLAERSKDASLAAQAVAGYQAALQLQARTRQPGGPVPLFQNEYGNALVMLGEARSDPQPVMQAVQQYQGAIARLAALRQPSANQRYDAAVLQLGLGNAYSVLAENFNRPADYLPAQKAYRAAENTLAHLDDEHGAVQSLLFVVRNNLADNLYLMGRDQRQVALLRQALAHTRQLLQDTAGNPSATLFSTRHTQGCALIALGELSGDAAQRQQGLHTLEQLKSEVRAADDVARYASIRSCEKRAR